MPHIRSSRLSHSHGSCHALLQACGNPEVRTVVVQPVQLQPLAARVDQAQDAGHVGRAALEPRGRAGAVRADQPSGREGQQRQAAKQHPPSTEQAKTALPSLKHPPLRPNSLLCRACRPPRAQRPLCARRSARRCSCMAHGMCISTRLKHVTAHSSGHRSLCHCWQHTRGLRLFVSSTKRGSCLWYLLDGAARVWYRSSHACVVLQAFLILCRSHAHAHTTTWRTLHTTFWGPSFLFNSQGLGHLAGSECRFILHAAFEPAHSCLQTDREEYTHA